MKTLEHYCNIRALYSAGIFYSVPDCISVLI